MKLLMLAKSNIKKNISMTITLTALIISATILLYIGTSIVLDMDSFLDDKNQELNGSDFTVSAPKEYEGTLQQVFREVGGYEQLETIDTVKFAAEFKNITRNDKSQAIGCLFLNADQNEQISKLKILDKGEKKLPNSIILPYYLKVAKAYKTGDELTITAGGKSNTFIVYGFLEDVMFAVPSNITYYKCYLFDEEFNKFFQENDAMQAVLIKARLEKGTDTDLYNEKYVKKMNSEIKDSLSDIITMDYDMMKVGVSIFLIIIMAVLIAFSFIILLIALTVMRFAIVTHIQGNMRNIGSMEALGFTGRELILSTILQFTMVAFAGVAIGFVIAALSIGLITNMVSTSIGLSWNAGINIAAMCLNLLIILALVFVISYVASAKLKKITPITALRSGVETHNFKRNYLPLSKSPLNINITLGLKNFLQNAKQNIIILIIVTLMSFVCVFTFTVNYNFNVNNTALLRLVGIEKSDLMTEYAGKDYQKYYDEISQMEHVKKTLQLNQINMMVRFGDRNITPTVAVCKDFDNLAIKTIVKGRYPVHDNEIAVTGLVLKRLKAELGDVITLLGNGNEQEFIIVGVTQQITNLGRGACITEEGMKRVNPEYTPSQLYIYLDDSEHIPAVMKALEDRYSQSGFIVNNIEESFETILASFNTAVIALCAACIIITLGIISLILFLLIKIKLLKERVRIGVSKALGYTTGQLIIQVIISFCPVCILGALIGTVTALFMIDPAFAAMLSVAGVQNSHFIMSPMLIIAVFLAVSAFSILITALVARGIKRITPCELFVQ